MSRPAGDEPFGGFPPETFTFLAGLARNNSKAWFDAHRSAYDRAYIPPAKALVSALGPELQAIAPAVRYEPRVNGSIFRINRDVRFSKDKTPYKPHLDLWFWEGSRKGWDSPGFFFRMFAERLILGAGMHQFGKAQLATYRQAVLDDAAGRELEAVLKAVGRGAKVAVSSPERKTVPRGFDKSHLRAHLLLHEGLHVGWEGVVPREARSVRFVAWCLDRWRGMAPLNDWLREYVASR